MVVDETASLGISVEYEKDGRTEWIWRLSGDQGRVWKKAIAPIVVAENAVHRVRFLTYIINIVSIC